MNNKAKGSTHSVNLIAPERKLCSWHQAYRWHKPAAETITPRDSMQVTRSLTQPAAAAASENMPCIDAQILDCIRMCFNLLPRCGRKPSFSRACSSLPGGSCVGLVHRACASTKGVSFTSESCTLIDPACQSHVCRLISCQSRKCCIWCTVSVRGHGAGSHVSTLQPPRIGLGILKCAHRRCTWPHQMRRGRAALVPASLQNSQTEPL